MTEAWADTLERAFREQAAAPALFVAGASYTYEEVWAAAGAFAETLVASTPAGGRIGLLAQRSFDAYVAILGCVLAGRPYVPINPKMPFERQLTVAHAADCAAITPDARSADRAEELIAAREGRSKLLAVTDARAPGFAPETVADTGHMYVMFTSGTTGTPKGVAVRRENVAAYVSAVREFVDVRPGDRCTQLFDLSFDLSVHDIFVTWANGACLHVPEEAELLDPLGYAAKHQLTCWFSVPSVIAMAKRFRRLKPGALPSIRLSLFCGEPLPVSLAREWSQAAPNARVLNLYGPTEATIAITAQEFSADAYAGSPPASVPLGRAYANCAAVVVDADGAPVAPGGAGELWLAGAQVTDGYINNPEEHRAKFVARCVAGYPFELWYRTGDLVRNDPAWGLVFESRLDDQVKISGYRVELLEIEEALRWAAGTGEAAAVPWPMAPEGGSAEGVVAFVCGSPKEDREIIAACRERLPTYMVPKKIIAVPELPLNANGKVDRRALRTRYLEAAPVS